MMLPLSYITLRTYQKVCLTPVFNPVGGVVPLPLPVEACVGLMKPEPLAVPFSGGLETPTELPLDEDLDAGILEIGFGIGLGAGLTGAGGALFTVATDAELFNELLELRKDAREVDLSTLKELARFAKGRFGSSGVRGGVFVSLVGIFFGISVAFFGVGDSHSILQPDEAPWEALSEFRL